MFLSWFSGARRASRAARRGGRRDGAAPAPGFRPRLECLEDRTLLTAATHFLVLAQQTANVGQPAYVEVIALDASNHRAQDYTGTVQITSTDPKATLPANYTFQAGDRGVAVFTVTPATTGTETITATDTAAASVTGNVAVQVNAAAVATHFLVLARPNALAGSATSVAVVALDASNRPVRNYTGTVRLTSTDAQTALPADYTFQAGDHGVHVFTVTPGATGTETITATDTAAASVTGNVAVQVNAAPVATHFLVVAPQNVQPGTATPVLVEALSAANRVVPTYTGTVQLTSSDAGATLPAGYTFQAGDHGRHVFMVTFAAAGSQAVTATDAAHAITGNDTVVVGQSTSSGGGGGGSGGGGFGGFGAFDNYLGGLFGHFGRFGRFGGFF
jgi:hypothetical protein